MTTIAYKRGVIAADTLITQAERVLGHMCKIGRRGPILFGVAGEQGLGLRFLHWCRAGLPGDPPSMGKYDSTAACGIIVMDDYVVNLDPGGMSYIKADYYAIGSGKPVALGVMECGKGAIEAVKAAIKLDIYSGGKVQYLKR